MCSVNMPTTLLRIFAVVWLLTTLGCSASGGSLGLTSTLSPGGGGRDGADEISLRAKLAAGGLGVQRARRQLAAVLREKLAAVPSEAALAPETVEMMREIVTLAPKDKRTRQRYGEALRSAGDWAAALGVLEADDSCESCLALRPGLYFEDGLEKLARGDGEGAAIALERSYSLEPDPVSLLFRARAF